ncbi:MAG: protein kinase [Sandaracinaceae bacterium]
MERVAGRYRLEAELGKGGMGAVYWANDEQTGNAVALKRILLPKKKRRAQKAVLRFQREFHTLASLTHPRIIRAFDYGVDARGPYYTMELLEGEDLRDVLKERGPLPPSEVCSILRDVTAALSVLHARGLLHRDLSPRNVRIVDGRATLFDFGVLVQAGLVSDVAGTPAYVAPEMLRGVPVDGRADLFSLGVLAYRMLTGVRPYDVRTLVELDHAWSQPVEPPSAIVPMPEGLEDLVLDLLALEPLARPPSAAVLIDRLTALGELEPDETLAISPGYVASAAMVGRDAELEVIDALLASAVEGGSTTFLLEAESGAGKSRLVTEVAIRAKLAGALALRVDCEKSEGGPFATLRRLIDAVFREAPELALAASRAEAPWLGRVFSSIRERHPDRSLAPESGEPAENRMQLQASVGRFLRALAAEKPLVILIDDVQRADEASAAALASLARAGVPKLLIGWARRLGETVRAAAAVASLSELEPRLRLGGLDEAGIHALLRSIFGEVPNLSRLVSRLASTTGGSPLLCTEIVRHLVETDAIRYAGGSWILPTKFPGAFPEGLAAAMQLRIEGLGPSVRQVAELLAVHGLEADLERALALTHGQLEGDEDSRVGVVFGALAELGQQGVLADQGDRLRFRHDSIREALLAQIEPESLRRLHRHVGEVRLAERSDGPTDANAEAEIGWHLYRGGEEARGAAMLERAGRRLFEAQALADCIAPLEAALSVRQQNSAPDAVLADLSYMLLAAGWVSDRAVGERYGPMAIELHEKLAGIRTMGRLRFLGWRLAFPFALALAFVRWIFRFGEARGPSPIRALSYFVFALSWATAIAYAANRKARVLTLAKRAEPFRAFAGQPPYAGYLMVQSMSDILMGRLEQASSRLTEARRLGTRRWFNPLTEPEQRLADAGCRSMRLIVDVNQFDARLYDDLDAIQELGLAYYRLAGTSVRAVWHRYRGEESKAREIEMEMEPTSLQLGAWTTDLQRLLFAHPAYAFTHDVEGLKRSLDALERRIAEGMELEVRSKITRAEIHRERGEVDAALAILEPLLDALDENDHLFRQYAASAAAQTGLECYRYEIAEKYARLGLEDGRDPAVRVLLPWLRCQRVLGLAEDALGRSADGARRIESAIEIAEARDCPVLAGELHEARARIAFAADDRLLFEVHRAKCANWLRPTENPGLVAVVERLTEMDREAEVRPVNPRRRRPGASSTETTFDRSSVRSQSSVSSPSEEGATVAEASRSELPRSGARVDSFAPPASEAATVIVAEEEVDRTVASSPAAIARTGSRSASQSVASASPSAPPESES